MKDKMWVGLLKDFSLLALVIIGLMGIGYFIKTTVVPKAENLFNNPELPIIKSDQDPRLM